MSEQAQTAPPTNEKIDASPAANSSPPAQPQVNLSDIKVDSENTALNLLVSFTALAQRRGAFNLEEAAKIFECVNIFRRNEPPATN